MKTERNKPQPPLASASPEHLHVAVHGERARGDATRKRMSNSSLAEEEKTLCVRLLSLVVVEERGRKDSEVFVVSASSPFQKSSHRTHTLRVRAAHRLMTVNGADGWSPALLHEGKNSPLSRQDESGCTCSVSA